MSMTLPVPVYVSRHGNVKRGDPINWRPGEKLVYTGKDGVHHNVTVISGLVGHDAVPGVECREVSFDDEGGEKHCVAARNLWFRDR